MQEQDRSPLGTLRSDLPELLKGVPVLSSLSDELRNAVAERATIVTLPAGEWLFHQGDAGDVMFLVLSGRVEVVLEQHRATSWCACSGGAAWWASSRS